MSRQAVEDPRWFSVCATLTVSYAVWDVSGVSSVILSWSAFRPRWPERHLLRRPELEPQFINGWIRTPEIGGASRFHGLGRLGSMPAQGRAGLGDAKSLRLFAEQVVPEVAGT